MFLLFRIDSYKELIKCTQQYCEEQNTALKALFKEELDKCLKTCEAGDKKLSALEEEDRKKIRECFRANKCKLPMEHIRENRDTPQFKALKQCAEDKCKEQFGKIKQLDGSFEP